MTVMMTFFVNCNVKRASVKALLHQRDLRLKINVLLNVYELPKSMERDVS